MTPPRLLDDRVGREPQARWRDPRAPHRRGEFLKRLHLMRLRVHLILLTLIGFVPTAGLLLYTTMEQHGHEASGAQEEALRLARVVAGEHERATEAARQLVAMLAQLPDVRQLRPDRCNALVTDLRRRYPRYANLGARGLNGSVFCGAVPVAEPPDPAGASLFWRALGESGAANGEYQIDRATGRITINVSHPLLDDTGAVEGTVFAAIDLAWLRQIPAVARLPEGSTLTISDRHCRIRVRYPDPAKWVGSLACERPIGDGEGSAETTGPDGIPRFVGFARLHSLDGGEPLYVAVGIPQHAALAATDWVYARNLAVLGLIATLALGAARLAGSRVVSQHVGALARATESPGRGGLDGRGAPRREPSRLGPPLEQPLAAIDERRPRSARRTLPRANWEPGVERRRFRREPVSRPVRQWLLGLSAAVPGAVSAGFYRLCSAIAHAGRFGLEKVRACFPDPRRARGSAQIFEPGAGGELLGATACACVRCRARDRGKRK